MSTTVTFTLDEDLSQEEKDHLRGVMCDALYEFHAHRGPSPEEYVNKRYPDDQRYAWLDREKKVRETSERRILSTKLHLVFSSGKFTVTDTEPVEGSES